jgi:hypothetical protein
VTPPASSATAMPVAQSAESKPAARKTPAAMLFLVNSKHLGRSLNDFDMN